MNTRQAYNNWAAQYDTDRNKTRDLEGEALRLVLQNISFDSCLEIGCGTGKNTTWLMQRAVHVTAVDLSEEMLARAKEKFTSDRVTFIQADILREWFFGAEQQYDLVSFSLVLEHLADLEPIFEKAANALKTSGYIYIGELHPFKQYTGTKARFDTESGRTELQCFTHHTSDFIQAAKRHNFSLQDLHEYFDQDDKNGMPRILALLLKKI